MTAGVSLCGRPGKLCGHCGCVRVAQQAGNKKAWRNFGETGTQIMWHAQLPYVFCNI